MPFEEQVEFLNRLIPVEESGLGFYVEEEESGDNLRIISSDLSIEYYYNVHNRTFKKIKIDQDAHLPRVPKKVLSKKILASQLRTNPLWPKTTGAFERIIEDSAPAGTVVYRVLSSSFRDSRFFDGELAANTYVTTLLEQPYLNTGLAAVGRLALPLPLPASYVVQYQLKNDTNILVGTVAPQFGQSGGGVEVLLDNVTPVQIIGLIRLPDY